MLPSVNQIYGNNFIYQQDNCSVHTSRAVRAWFMENNVNTLPWPSHSPDLNPIENVWGLLVKEIYKREFRPRNIDQLWEAIEDGWETVVTNDLCRRLASSMPRRLAKVIISNGAMTK